MRRTTGLVPYRTLFFGTFSPSSQQNPPSQQASSPRDGDHSGTHFTPSTSTTKPSHQAPTFDTSFTQSSSPATPLNPSVPSASNSATTLLPAATTTISIDSFTSLHKKPSNTSPLTSSVEPNCLRAFSPPRHSWFSS